MVKKFTGSIILLVFLPFVAFSWSGETHRGITTLAEKKPNVPTTNYLIHKYLISLGIARGHDALFPLSDALLSRTDDLQTPDFADRVKKGLVKTRMDKKDEGGPKTALGWLVYASMEEDAPLTRASNHFH